MRMNSSDIKERENFPQVVVAGLLFDDEGKVFLAKGANFYGKYAIPGGHVCRGEKLVDALRREIFEETGLRIMEAVPFRVGESIFDSSYKDGNQHFVFIDYVCKFQGQLTLDGVELSDPIWVSPTAALRRKDLTDMTRESLSAYISQSTNFST
jgi:nucleoside triphosphatase